VKTLLLNPPAVRGVRYVREGRCEQRLSSFQYNMLPVSLPSTAALLRERNHEVKILDATALNLTVAETIDAARAFSPGLVLINVSTPTFGGDAAVALLLKRALPGSFLVAFGVHVTALPEESLKASRFDAVIRREPEVTAAALADTLAQGEPLHNVEGLSFRTQWKNLEHPGPIAHNPDRPFFEDLNLLPPPALDLIDHRHYPAPVSGDPHTLIVTSRGCPHQCTFCTARLFYGSRLRLREPAAVVDEIEKVHREQGVKLFTFWSDTFTLDREHVLGICHELLKRGLNIRWMGNSRVDRIDEELLLLMAKAGCQVISYGVESGAQEILDRAAKGITIAQIVRAFDLTRKSGIQSAAHIIFGLPGESSATLRQTLRLVRKIRPDYVQFYGAIPFPGTQFYREAVAKKWLTTDDWDDFEINNNIVATPSLSAQNLGRWRRRAYLTFYLDPRYIVSRLKGVRNPGDIRDLRRAGWDFLRSWVFRR